MRAFNLFNHLSIRWIRGITFVLALIAWIAAEILSGWQSIHAAFWISALAISILIAWLAGEIVILVRGQHHLKRD